MLLSMFEKFLNHYLFILTIWTMFIIYNSYDEQIFTIHLCTIRSIALFWIFFAMDADVLLLILSTFLCANI